MGTTFLNIHTHCPCPANEYTITSAGLHPWHVTEGWAMYLATLEKGLLAHPADSVVVIGECGLDRRCSAPYGLQIAAFEAQVKLGNRLQKPLIIHCVRAFDDLLRLHRQAHTPWVIHGFRGKPEQMQQLLRAGLFISFGWHYNSQSLTECPADRLFLETDEGRQDTDGNTDNSIAPLYAEVAALRHTTAEALAAQTAANASHLCTQSQ